MSNVPVRREANVNIFDPFRMMRELLQNDGVDYGRWADKNVWNPPFEVKETKDAYVFRADLPGVKQADIDVQLTGDRLTISGKREAQTTTEKEAYYAYERTFGSFTRSFTLPAGVSADQARADLKEGVMTLVLPKSSDGQTKRIAVTTDAHS